MRAAALVLALLLTGCGAPQPEEPTVPDEHRVAEMSIEFVWDDMDATDQVEACGEFWSDPDEAAQLVVDSSGSTGEILGHAWIKDFFTEKCS